MLLPHFKLIFRRFSARGCRIYHSALVDASDEDLVGVQQLTIFELRFARVLLLNDVNLVLDDYRRVGFRRLSNFRQMVMVILLILVVCVVVDCVETVAISLLNCGERAN